MSPSDPITVAEVVAKYLAYSEQENLHTAEALYQRKQRLGLFVAEFGTLPVDQCKAFMLRDWILSRPSWKSPATRKGTASMVKACFNWAFDMELVGRNPFRAVRFADSPPRPPMPDDCLDDLCELASKRYERALRFLRLTGCRSSEMCNATWLDVDLERGSWLIPRHKSKRYSGRAKLVALVPEAVAILREIRKWQPDDYHGVIFLNGRNNPWTRQTLYQNLTRMKKRYAIDTPAAIHSIRHTMGTAAVAAGAPMKLIAEQLGHSTTAMIEKHYWHPSPDHIDAMKRAAAMGAPKHE